MTGSRTPTVSVVVISKNEPALEATLRTLAASEFSDHEVIVVDASSRRLDAIADANPHVVWVPFTPPPGVRVSIPHQRNRGVAAASGRVIAFTDAGCIVTPDWLATLVDPILAGIEEVTCGPALGSQLYDPDIGREPRYVTEAPTINLAFTREAFDAVGGFDESFEYGSDVDFTWRLHDTGRRILSLPGARIHHDWGGRARQRRRSMQYGAARVRLYAKHRARIRGGVVRDPMTFAYPLYVLGLPLTLRFRWYPLLLVVPLLRARKHPKPLTVVADHLAFGVGGAREVVRLARRAAP